MLTPTQADVRSRPRRCLVRVDVAGEATGCPHARPEPKTGSASRRTPAWPACPLHGFNQNQIWCAIVQIAVELTAWLQMLALTSHDARRWEPKRLRLRLFSTAGRLPPPPAK